MQIDLEQELLPEGDFPLVGIVYSRDIENNRPYYIVSYRRDDGSKGVLRIAKNTSREFLEHDFLALVFALKKLEARLDPGEYFKIGFGVKEDDTVCFEEGEIFHTEDPEMQAFLDHEFRDTKAYAKCSYLDLNHVMSDFAYWNPASILGNNPRPLDVSIFRTIIANKVWSEGMEALGYRKVDTNLMQLVGNKPYISLDYAVEGLTPAGISDELTESLHDYYIDRYRDGSYSHMDPISGLVISSYDLTTEKRLEELLNHGFLESDIMGLREALKRTTFGTMEHIDEIVAESRSACEKLTALAEEIRKEDPERCLNVMKLYSRIGELLTAIRDQGLFYFIRFARLSTVVLDYCRSLSEEGVLKLDQIKDGINNIYVRLGGFDVREIGSEKDVAQPAAVKHMAEFADTIKMNKVFKHAGIPIKAEPFCRFADTVKENRDFFRYECMKSIYLLLSMVARAGELLGIAKEDLSYLEIQDLTSYHSRDSYIEIIEERRNMYYAYKQLILPHKILNVGDIDVIREDEAAGGI